MIGKILPKYLSSRNRRGPISMCKLKRCSRVPAKRKWLSNNFTRDNARAGQEPLKSTNTDLFLVSRKDRRCTDYCSTHTWSNYRCHSCLPTNAKYPLSNRNYFQIVGIAEQLSSSWFFYSFRFSVLRKPSSIWEYNCDSTVLLYRVFRRAAWTSTSSLHPRV